MRAKGSGAILGSRRQDVPGVVDTLSLLSLLGSAPHPGSNHRCSPVTNAVTTAEGRPAGFTSALLGPRGRNRAAGESALTLVIVGDTPSTTGARRRSPMASTSGSSAGTRGRNRTSSAASFWSRTPSQPRGARSSAHHRGLTEPTPNHGVPTHAAARAPAGPRTGAGTTPAGRARARPRRPLRRGAASQLQALTRPRRAPLPWRPRQTG